jgi:signal transduction histidine kinase
MDEQLSFLDLHFGREYTEVLQQLRREVNQYWRAQERVFLAPDHQVSAVGAAYVRQQITPRRFAVLSVADQIDRLSRANLKKEAERTTMSLEGSRRFLGTVFSLALLLAFVASGFAVIRVSRLERQSESERDRAETAEKELRRLSHELVRTQEEERKAISRELHDEVGQTLTALRLVLGRLERARHGSENDFRSHVEECKALAESSLRTVRDLAMGLRPSMLDDLGLGPALGWQAREFSRRTGVPANVEYPQDLASLPDEVRTCLYRVAQEALTNCARHSKAKSVRIAICQEPGGVSLTVEDDGMGFEPSDSRGQGLGLIGVEERVKELGGNVTVSSDLFLGTRLRAEIPLSGEEPS